MGEVTYIDAARETPDGALRALLGDDAGLVRDCKGDCGRLVLGWKQHAEIPEERKKAVRALNVIRDEGYGYCNKCLKKAKEAGVKFKVESKTKRPLGSRLPFYHPHDFPTLWKENLLNGGGYGEVAARFGCTRQAVQQAVWKFDLERADHRKRNAENFLEELEFLYAAGEGVYSIARALGMTPDALVNKIEGLRAKGKTTVKFEGWGTPNGTSQKEAA